MNGIPKSSSDFGVVLPRAFVFLGVAILGATLVATSAADDDSEGPIFRPFRVPTGVVQSAAGDPALDETNKFFDPGLGTNGQACVTCHEPELGFTITPSFIRQRFADTDGLDPLFRVNDTADRPDADVSTVDRRRDAFSLFLDLGVIRIGKTFPAMTDFTLEPQDTSRFGMLPNGADSQSTSPTLSLFRRPLVNTNVRFDSAVLWDGRASIADMRGQVQRAARALLLAGGPLAGPLGDVSNADADEVAAFMLGVFTTLDFDDNAGELHARGAMGGVANLTELAFDPAAPCLFFGMNMMITPLTPPTCTQSSPRPMSLFDAWADAKNVGRNASRAAVVRGQQLFNTVDLHFRPGVIVHCVSCHATNNVGNNPSAEFFIRLGMDSVQTLNDLAAGDPRVTRLLDRVKKLPEYCVRPTSDPTSFSAAPCGTREQDMKTTDPGRALFTGQMMNIGAFKPPILRDLPVRAPFFHNGSAETLDDVVNFYNARFRIGLTPQQHDDLVAFLRSL